MKLTKGDYLIKKRGSIISDEKEKVIMGEIDELKKILVRGNVDGEVFKFLEHQLGVLDKKASAIMALDGILLALTASFMAILEDVPYYTRIAFLIASVFVLLSAIFCIYILWTKWASEIIIGSKSSTGFDKLIKLRNRKTKSLGCSLVSLLIALVSYMISIGTLI